MCIVGNAQNTGFYIKNKGLSTLVQKVMKISKESL